MNKNELANNICKELERRTMVIESAKNAGMSQSIINGLLNDYMVCLDFAQKITNGKIEIVNGTHLKLTF